MKSYNIRFPIKDNPDKKTYFSLNRITKDAFSSDLLLLLLTKKGERYYEPEYGTNLLKYIFEVNDELSASDIEQEIKTTVSTFIPNLKITKVTFNKVEIYQLNVNVKFIYTENAFSEEGVLDINF